MTLFVIVTQFRMPGYRLNAYYNFVSSSARRLRSYDRFLRTDRVTDAAAGANDFVNYRFLFRPIPYERRTTENPCA
jgi:hypothetical protein